MIWHKITLMISDAHRSCVVCGKSLAEHKSLLCVINPPEMDVPQELCSWWCLARYAIRNLKAKHLDTKLAKTDILANLGWKRSWGDQIPKEELESEIHDPIEDR